MTCKFKTPYTASELDLYAQVTAGSTGSVVFTNGTISTTITLGVIQFPDVTPVMSNKDEIFLQLEGIARSTGATKEIAFTLSLSHKTIETHRTRIMRKMRANSVAELVRMVVTLCSE